MAEFHPDHNVARELAGRLRQAGHGAHTARELALERAGDEEHLSRAARASRILVTHNARDFALLHGAWRRWSSEWETRVHHSGILVLIPPTSPVEAAQVILALLESGKQLRDELYVWRRHTGWTRYP